MIHIIYCYRCSRNCIRIIKASHKRSFFLLLERTQPVCWVKELISTACKNDSWLRVCLDWLLWDRRKNCSWWPMRLSLSTLSSGKTLEASELTIFRVLLVSHAVLTEPECPSNMSRKSKGTTIPWQLCVFYRGSRWWILNPLLQFACECNCCFCFLSRVVQRFSRGCLLAHW